MRCKKCKREVTRIIDHMCVPCYIDTNLPTKVENKTWVSAFAFGRRRGETIRLASDFDQDFSQAIEDEKVVIDKKANIMAIQKKNEVLSVPITTEDIDNLALKSGILVGKWLIHRMESEIDSAWRLIGTNTFDGHLGTSAKVSTSLHKTRKYVICVYTHDYLNLGDVKRIREKLRALGFGEELCYKPDIYTYLGIYYRTTSLSPCRYRM